MLVITIIIIVVIIIVVFCVIILIILVSLVLIAHAQCRMASLGVTFRRYKPCNCRARAGMVAPRAPLRLAHLLDQSDED